MLTYSLNAEWRGVCPVCTDVTRGEDVVDTPLVGEATSRIYAVCDVCGWEGLGVTPVLPTDPSAPTSGGA